MEGRRRMTLYDQMTAGNTSSRDSLASLFLDDVVLPNQKTEAEAEADGSRELSRNRTLLDIIREDAPTTKDRRSWKAFKDKLRLKRAFGLASENSSNSNNNASLSQFSSRNSVSSQTRLDSDESTQQNSASEQQNGVVAQVSSQSSIQYGSSDEDSEEHETERTVVADSTAAATANVSLMDLLEETDQEMGIEMELSRMSDDDDVKVCEEEQAQEQEQLEGGVVEYNCCVCMVRHKGAAFIPCGHTFCRMCSRELWVSRGNCPLCNNFILEILDIF